jgi:hypothetical protein
MGAPISNTYLDIIYLLMVQSRQVILVNDRALGKERQCGGGLVGRPGDHSLVTECAWWTIELDDCAEAFSTRGLLLACLDS